MDERNKKTELLVGLFLFVGLILLGGLILKFSSLRELWKNTYEITVPFHDATGVKEGTPIILGGSRVGKVPRSPELNDQFNGVIVPLEIYQDKRIPSDAKFNIGTAGLLGDAYIEIRPSGKDTSDYIKPGTRVPAASVSTGNGIGALTDTATSIGKKATDVLDGVNNAAAELRSALTNVNKGALNDATLESFRSSMKHLEATMKHVDEEVLGSTNKDNLAAALANLKEATDTFKHAAASMDDTVKRLGPLLDKVDPAISKIDKAMTSADAALQSFKQSGDNLSIFTKDMAKGDGLMKALLLDKDLRDDFKDLISNLKRHGVLWYRDDNDKEESQQKLREEQEKQRRNSSSNPLRGPGR